MVQIPLNSGAYTSENYIANAQRCINLYPEKNPQETDPKFPTTHYVRPGLKLLSQPPQAMAARCIYRATNGDVFGILGQFIYYISPDYAWIPIGQLDTNATTPAYMSDNAIDVIIVDGSVQGYSFPLSNSTPRNYPANVVTQITDPNFLGSDRVDYLDTFFILNVPGTNQWYCSLSNQVAFNGLFIGVKTAWPDPIQCVVAIEREAYLLGTLKSEPWFNAGATPFPFQIYPGEIIEQGCVAKYSPAKMDTNIYWLSESPEGARMVMRGNAQNVAQRISTHSIEKIFLKYRRVDDAIGSTYQIEGHSFYQLHFPTADRTWTFDQATEQWWEDCWIDINGELHRSRNTFVCYGYGLNLALDWANGNLYQIDKRTYTDNGNPIPWIRSFPHFANELKYVGQAAIVADVDTGTRIDTGETGQTLSPWNEGFNSGFGPLTKTVAPYVALRISRDGGTNYGNNRLKRNISSGRYRSMMRWRGNGIARDWVLEFSSTAEMSGALNGAYIDPIAGGA